MWGKWRLCAGGRGEEEQYGRKEEGNIRVEEKPFERYTSVALS